MDTMRQRFRDLHTEGCFVMPNPWDAGSAKVLAALGFAALATTSSGHAATLGRRDQHVTLDELVAHASQLVEAVDVPLNVDAEHGFADDPEGVAEAVDRLGGTGAAGFSIEDFVPGSGIEPLPAAVERVAVAADANRRHGMVFTARAENLLYGAGDLDDTIARIRAYRDAGADVVYAPGLVRIDDISRVVESAGTAVNVLLRPGGPTVGELADVGVRRVSTGGALAFAAYAEMARLASSLRDDGTAPVPSDSAITTRVRAALG